MNLAVELNKLFLEVIIANGFDSNAIKILKAKKNLRLIDGTNYTSEELFKFVSFNQDIMIQSEDLNYFQKKILKLYQNENQHLNNLKILFLLLMYADM